MEIKVLGPGCANCQTMEQLVKKAVTELGAELGAEFINGAKIEKISDIQEIMKYTMSTPGLVVNGKLKHAGKPLPGLEKVKAMIKEEA